MAKRVSGREAGRVSRGGMNRVRAGDKIPGHLELYSGLRRLRSVLRHGSGGDLRRGPCVFLRRG